MADDHLSDDQMLEFAEGGELSQPQRGHLERCEQCRARSLFIRELLDGLGDEILEFRPGCPLPEFLADIPPGGEADHAHVQTCPLCQEELRLHRELEQERSTGFNVEGVPLSLLGGEMAAVFRSAGASLRVHLVEGAEVRGRIAGAFVRIEVVGGEIVVVLESEPDQLLMLWLTDERVERRVPLVAGELRLPLSSWRWASVERASEAVE